MKPKSLSSYIVAALAIVVSYQGLLVLTGVPLVDRKVAERAALLSYYKQGPNFFKWIEDARPYRTVLVAPAYVAPGQSLAVPTEGGGTEQGYYMLFQALSLLGMRVNAYNVALVHSAMFYFSAIVFTAALGAVLKGFYSASFVVLIGLLAFHRFNPAQFYGVVGPWTFVTSWPLIVMSAVLSLHRQWPHRRGFWAVAGMLGVLAGLLGILRESEATVLLATAIAWLIGLSLMHRPRRWGRAIFAPIMIWAVSACIAPAVYKGVVLHRASKTGLAPKLYQNAGHGPWHVLYMSLGRYPNPAGIQYKDVYNFELVRRLAPDEPIFSSRYLAVLRDRYVDFIRSHPAYFAAYVLRGARDYGLFLPYALFLGRSAFIGAHLPIVRQESMANEDRLPTDGESLINLRLRYLYLRGWQWALFVVILGAFSLGFYLIPAYPQLAGFYLSFLFYSGLRILIPMHGETALFSFYSIALVNVGLAWHASRRRAGQAPAKVESAAPNSEYIAAR